MNIKSVNLDTETYSLIIVIHIKLVIVIYNLIYLYKPEFYEVKNLITVTCL